MQTDPTLSNLLSYTTINQIMQKSIREIRRWIKQSTTHIHTHQEGAKNQESNTYYEWYTKLLSAQGKHTTTTDSQQKPVMPTVGISNSIVWVLRCYANGTSDNTIIRVTFFWYIKWKFWHTRDFGNHERTPNTITGICSLYGKGISKVHLGELPFGLV